MDRNVDSHLVLDTDALGRAIHDAGYESVRAFADALGLHRNTVGNYLNGQTALPDALERMLVALDLGPGEVLRLERRTRHVPGLEVVELVDTLHRMMPDAAFVLFGSRARGTAKRYSDFDLGVHRTHGLEFSDYSRLLDVVGEWNQENLHEAQLVDLVAADAEFVRGIADDLIFLAGAMGSWCSLLERAGRSIHG